MTDEIIVFLLFRKKLRPLLEGISNALLPNASIRENGGERSAAHFVELVQEALQYRFHGRDWYLHGVSTGEPAPEALKLAHVDISFIEVQSYIMKLAEAYSWCLVPWGVYGTGQMIAFISRDPTIFTRVKKYLVESNQDLLVSSYGVEDLKEKRFRGAIFRGEDEHRSQHLWTWGRGNADSALVLTYDSNPPLPSQVPRNAEIICETLGYQFQPVLRRWIRVQDENALAHYLKKRTAIVTAPGLDERLLWLALQDFAEVANFVNEDRLYFGRKALETASWIYIPRHDDQGWEIYINRDQAMTTRFLEGGRLTCVPGFLHKYFC